MSLNIVVKKPSGLINEPQAPDDFYELMIVHNIFQYIVLSNLSVSRL